MITAIVAWADRVGLSDEFQERIIGVDGDLPWPKVTEDMAFFR